MRAAYDVESVRSAEAALKTELDDGTLMQRAAFGLARTCCALLADLDCSVVGSRVVLLVGSGNNGGDALYAGAFIARRGAHVTALLLSDNAHDGGVVALRMAGGRIVAAAHAGADAVAAFMARADLILDGIVGIGARGPLRGLAAEVASIANESGALVVAVDLPSGMDPDSGQVEDESACIDADVTVTFGCLKQGLLIAPGRDFAGAVVVVDIGLDEVLPSYGVGIVDEIDIAACVPEPSASDYKYSRGVVGVIAGCERFRGAPLMVVGAARAGDVGMVHVLDRGDGIAQTVVEEFWDATASADSPVAYERATAWIAGPGIGTGSVADVAAVLEVDTPVVLDADALTIVGAHADLRESLVERGDQGLITVLTPHVGEFRSLGFGDALTRGRLDAARVAAAELHCIVVLKGPGTIIAGPDGTSFVDAFGGAELGTAGSGDVLAGITGALLAGATARGELTDAADAAYVVAAAVALHGLAGREVAEDGGPVTAMDIVEALPAAVASVRRVME